MTLIFEFLSGLLFMLLVIGIGIYFSDFKNSTMILHFYQRNGYNIFFQNALEKNRVFIFPNKRKFNIILLYHPLQFRTYLKNYYKTKKYKVEIPLRYKKDPFGLFIKRHIDGKKKKHIGKFILYQYLNSNDNNIYLGFCDYLWKDHYGNLCITLQDLSKGSLMLYSSYTINNIVILAIEKI